MSSAGVDDFAQPYIRNLGIKATGQKDIGALDVQVHDVATVQIGQPPGNI